MSNWDQLTKAPLKKAQPPPLLGSSGQSSESEYDDESEEDEEEDADSRISFENAAYQYQTEQVRHTRNNSKALSSKESESASDEVL